ncbi:MAG: OmpA family protein [Aliivibrio sp.]|uniref:OmpA family protein n=1 Tax=Aliivibrio sp. TaxID=1872443 RepID=UPI001A5CA265|nr:OmpA family protein [Aliivibrio sp.]
MNKYLPLFAVVSLSGCMMPDITMLDVAPHEAPRPDIENSTSTKAKEYDLTGPQGELKNAGITRVAEELQFRQIPFGYDSTNRLVIVIEDNIHFSTASSALTAESTLLLSNLVKVFERFDDLELIIDGHADESGDKLMNQTLSEQRANRVRRFFLEGNLSTKHLYSRGFGEYMPLCSNSTLKGKQCNRRVEITVVQSQTM